MGLARGGVAALLILGLALFGVIAAGRLGAAVAPRAEAAVAPAEPEVDVNTLDPDEFMDLVCRIKLQDISDMTPAWTRFCKERGFVGA